MSINNAINFIKRGMNDPSLRKRLNMSTSPGGLTSVLSDEELLFSESDFDEAYHYQLVQCQEKENADQLSEFKLWWELLSTTISPSACRSGSNCSSCHS